MRSGNCTTSSILNRAVVVEKALRDPNALRAALLASIFLLTLWVTVDRHAHRGDASSCRTGKSYGIAEG